MDTSRANRLTAVLGCLPRGRLRSPTSIRQHAARSYADRPEQLRPGDPSIRAGEDRRPHRITRQDLGVAWSIDAKAGTYTETSRSGARRRTNGRLPDSYDYVPVFDWKPKIPASRRSLASGPEARAGRRR
jgi:hypothetical protein